MYHPRSLSKSPRVYEEGMYETQVYHDPGNYVPATVPLDREIINQSAAEALLEAREIIVDLYDIYIMTPLWFRRKLILAF